MRVYDIIRKKRDGLALNDQEINFLIKEYVQGRIPEYQMAAWAMAVFFQGMDIQEIASLTDAMVTSGDRIDLSNINGIKVDKHSTGGVGDKTTLILAPLVAAAGGKMAKMSGRGLGHTGGTLDKFEAIPGFQVELTTKEFERIVNQVGAAVIGQTGNLVPADKKLYALRDVTATVDSIPLIASSVMSKKIAAGADAIVLDVKVGHGAFVKDLDEAFSLARIMVGIGDKLGRETIAVITNMNQPLGYAVGNALEVKEAVETLLDGGPSDLRELCLALGSQLLVLSQIATTYTEARKQLQELLQSKAGFRKLQEMVKAQKGNPNALEDRSLLPKAQQVLEVRSTVQGYVQEIQAEEIGIASTLLGAGRETKEATIDPAVGIILNKKVGDPVEPGEPLAYLHVNNHNRLRIVQEKIISAFKIGSKPIETPALIYGIVTSQGEERLTAEKNYK